MIPKFRVWDKTDKEMYLVDVINFNRGEFESIGDGITFLREADEVILMQSTGLFDKNGQEIFEGDILYGNDGEDFWEFVEFDEENAKWVRTDLNGYKLDLSENVTELEVVGNVYQNPELLEVIR